MVMVSQGGKSGYVIAFGSAGADVRRIAKESGL